MKKIIQTFEEFTLNEGKKQEIFKIAQELQEYTERWLSEDDPDEWNKLSDEEKHMTVSHDIWNYDGWEKKETKFVKKHEIQIIKSVVKAINDEWEDYESA